MKQAKKAAKAKMAKALRRPSVKKKLALLKKEDRLLSLPSPALPVKRKNGKKAKILRLLTTIKKIEYG